MKMPGSPLTAPSVDAGELPVVEVAWMPSPVPLTPPRMVVLAADVISVAPLVAEVTMPCRFPDTLAFALTVMPPVPVDVA